MPAECIFIKYLSGDGCGVGRVVTVRSRGPYRETLYMSVLSSQVIIIMAHLSMRWPPEALRRTFTYSLTWIARILMVIFVKEA